MHVSSTRFPHRVFALVAILCVLVAGGRAAEDPTLLFRIFLNDGTTLVSYGEFARVAGGMLWVV